ncbi:NAD(P)/FAD-dependent oxidoreductase [Marinivivus vitaminiproducens]|uniref:NAD(P)/FAD-dependent oxidoreductase n=1 Tax=Marinivivus vitaminiproducens TaxID=3035935 RepID=UPI00279D9B1D|nr:FAD-dependent oxidoreductase [Geminicoccaceae bacterium SCSIO 64248]
MKVIVVGGGIMGLATAWGLHRRGHAVTVYEQGPIPNPLGSSGDQHRLIRYPYGDLTGYARMVRQAYEAWQLLWGDLGAEHYHASGTLCVVRDGQSGWVRQAAVDLGRMHLPFEELGAAEVAERYPFIDTHDVRHALHTPSGGVLFPERITAALAKHLRIEGHGVFAQTPVAGVDAARAIVRLADGKADGGDAVVVAAGPWADRLVPGLRGRVTPSRQVAVYLDPPAAYAKAWAAAPMILDQVEATSGGFYAVPPVAGTGLKIGDHTFSRAGDPDRDRDASEDDIARVTGLCRGRLKAFEDYRPVRGKTCFYTVTEDERFIAERQDRGWILSPCSGHGFKFGAIIGLAAADAIDGGREASSLAEWAAGRQAA